MVTNKLHWSARVSCSDWHYIPEPYVLLNPVSACCFTDAFLLVLLGAACGFSVATGSRADRDVLLLSVLLCSLTCVAACD